MATIDLVLSGVPLQISTSSARLTSLFLDYFRYYSPINSDSAPSAVAVRLELDICQELPPLPDSAHLIARTGVLQFWEESAGIYLFHTGVAAFRVDVARQCATGWVVAAAFDFPHILANTYAMFPLLLLLRSQRRYHLHAAALISPRGRLWLITGSQRSGKTTLTTALGLAGWRPISDDSLVLLAGEADRGFRIESLRKYFHLGDALLERWSGLAGIVRHHQYLDRTCVGGLEFFDSQREAEHGWPRVDYVLRPQITGREQSRLVGIPASEVLLTLAEQSVFLQLWRDQTVEQWRLLEGLVSEAKGCRLDSGLDLLEDPALAARVLGDFEDGVS